MTSVKERRNHHLNNFKKRKGNRGDSLKAHDEEKNKEKTNEEESKEPRKPKKKVAVLVGFCGTGYQGMQIARTIEDELFKAFVAVGAVSKDNSDDPKKATRTDKGVHAAGNLISLKIYIPDLVEKINQNLPEQIRMWVYEYLIPSYVFIPPSAEKKSSDHDRCEQASTNTLESEISLNSNDVTMVEKESSISTTSSAAKLEVESSNNRMKFIEAPLATAEEMIEKRKYRITPEMLEYIRQGFKLYEGTHNYHNFTIGRNPLEKSCNRFIINVEVGEPKIINDTEWLSLKVHGQSFMLHQIRKMVALIVMVARTMTPLSLIPKTFGATKINIPKAPALGLLLENPVFSSYNKRAKDNGRDLIEFQAYKDKIEEFKNKFIYSKIYEEEFSEYSFQNWINSIDAHAEQVTPLSLIPKTFGATKINIPKAPALGLLLENPVFSSYNKRAKDNGRDLIEFQAYKVNIEE
ncbi:17771_t:CDS:10 [Entrophospora sp. SA101]|nr:17771_t:CDS:10 [Entrophospora sp. SA101]